MQDSPTANTAPTILVTGATGFIGGRLASAAMEHGLGVRTLTRSEWPGPPRVLAAERHLGSLPFCIPDECLAGVQAVVHCAAQTGPGSEREARAVNVEGSVLLARQAREHGVSRFVFLSSQSASERAPSAYGRTKHEAERELLRLAGIETIVLRPGLVYGPGSRGLYGRMRGMVERLPVLPLLGGGAAPVQPIHVDDLCQAILRALKMPLEGSRVLSLGDPDGIRLVELLQAISRARRGRRRPILPIPLGPVTALVGWLERLGVPLPVTTDNLQGLQAVQLMETRADLARLGIELRPLREGLREDLSPTGPAPDSPSPESTAPTKPDPASPESVSSGPASPGPASPAVPLARRPVGVALVGAGRIGTLHALTAGRSRGLHLAAVVDKSRAALGRLAGLGVRARHAPSLDEALAAGGIDAVVIATPATSHLPLARQALAAGRAVLVEKPLAIRAEALADYEVLAAQDPPPRIQVGYLAPRYPQVERALEGLRAGAYGQVRRFVGLTLLTLIQERDSKRWEVRPKVSGGGVLINSGGHVLSLVHAAFGDPQTIAARALRPWSSQVEDTLVADLGYAGFRGRCLATWSIDGYPRQENRLVIWTDRGALTLTNNTAVFEPAGGGLELAHQLDFDVGFNLMPDYAGGGIAAEHRDLERMVRDGRRPPMGLPQAVAVERLMFRLYDAARADPAGEPPVADAPAQPPDVAGAETPATSSTERPRPPAAPDAWPDAELILDLRSLGTEELARALGGAAAERWAGFVVHPPQVRAALASGVAEHRLRVTVPDFLHQARLIASARHRELLAYCGLRGLAAATLAVLRVAGRARDASFWVAARGLLAADLARVPRGFAGTLLLQSYLTDLAVAVGRPREATRLLEVCRRRAPRATVGVHTNRLGDARALLALDGAPAAVHFLASPNARGLAAAVEQLAAARPGVALTAEVGDAPAAVHRLAAREPARWLHGAAGTGAAGTGATGPGTAGREGGGMGGGALVVGVAADPELLGRRRQAAALAWQSAFPNIAMPDEVL